MKNTYRGQVGYLIRTLVAKAVNKMLLVYISILSVLGVLYLIIQPIGIALEISVLFVLVHTAVAVLLCIKVSRIINRIFYLMGEYENGR